MLTCQQLQEKRSSIRPGDLSASYCRCADAAFMNQSEVKSRECHSEIIGNSLVVVATARDRNDFNAVATAVAAANRTALEPTTQSDSPYVLGDLVSTSHSVTKDTNTVVAVVVATYGITRCFYYEPDE